MDKVDPLDVQVFAFVLLLLAGLYVWIRHVQGRQKVNREMKIRCRDLILGHRHALVAAGIDIEGLVDLVRMNITCEQLDAVIKVLLRPRKQYSVDQINDPQFLEVNLDPDARDSQAKAENESTPSEGQQPDNGVQAGATPDQSSGSESDGENAAAEKSATLPDKMEPAEEKAWLKLVRSRFREAIDKRGISERRARLKLLVRMIELGKKAVDEDPAKSYARKEYERALWDRFYESEYLELNSDERQG